MLALALAASFAPTPDGGTWIYELVGVIALYPLILAGRLGRRPGPPAARRSNSRGRLSYPLYLVHWPVFGLLLLVPGLEPHGGLEEGVALLLGSLASIAVAALALKLWDEPVRRRLGVGVQRSGTPSAAGRMILGKQL